MPEITIPNNWQPRQDQMPLWEYMEAGGLRACQVSHRRWGKDDVALHYTATALIQRPGNYWHMLPQYNQARKVIWDAVNPRTGKKRIDEAFPVEIRKQARRNEMSIEFLNGAIWQLVGSDNYNAYVGSPPLGIVLSEWAVANPMAWAFLSPILEENGGWAIFIYTSRGNNHGFTMYEHACAQSDWHAQKLTALETPVFTAKQLSKIKTEYIQIYGLDLGAALYEQEYLCSFDSAVPGAYFGAEIAAARAEGRITQVPYEPDIAVNTFWDLGIDDSMTIWFHQAIPSLGQHRFIDYHEVSGVGLAACANVLYEKREANGWMYGRHVAPHDIKVRELISGKSRWESARRLQENGEAKMSIDFEIAHRPENKEDAIEVSRQILKSCWFDSEKCKGGVNALSNYSKKWDELNHVWSKTPDHSWACHGADGFQTFSIAYNIFTDAQDDLKVVFG